MSKTNDKEKSIKFHWLVEVRDWLGAMAPAGKLEEYFQVEFHSDPGWEGAALRKVKTVTVTFFTRTYEYRIKFSEDKILLVLAVPRKPHAGRDAEDSTSLVDATDRTPEMWHYILNQIMAWEMVKVFKLDRQEERFEHWRNLTSHYSSDGKEKIAEWEQKDDEIRNHRIYERVR